MVTAWIRACHPAPTATVTIIVTALAAKVGWLGWPLAALAVAVVLGQLSVGWSNDAVDAEADARAHRIAKPTVSAALDSRRLLTVAAITAVAACLLSWAIAGPVGGTCHVIGIGMGWLYNLRLSRTGWAWVPYAIAFGLLPAFVTFGLDGSWPPLWLTLAFAVIGVSAHLANSLRDLDVDDAIDLDGTARRLGGRRTRMLAVALLAMGTVVVAGALWSTSTRAAVTALVAVGILLALAVRTAESRAFALFLGAAAILAACVIVGM